MTASSLREKRMRQSRMIGQGIHDVCGDQSMARMGRCEDFDRHVIRKTRSDA